MNKNYLNIYNNLIKLTTNKNLYLGIKSQDTFSDRLILFLFHFNFRQMELTIREIGYGDQSINKKMKDYINLFHSIISDIHYWDDLDTLKKKRIIGKFFENFEKIDHLVDYFQIYNVDLSKKTLNSFIKSVSND